MSIISPGPLPNLHAFRLFFSPHLIRFFSSPGFTTSSSLSSPCTLLLLFLPLLPLGVSYPSAPSACLCAPFPLPPPLSLPPFLLLFPSLLGVCFIPLLLFLCCSLPILPLLSVDFFPLALSSFFSCFLFSSSPPPSFHPI